MTETGAEDGILKKILEEYLSVEGVYAAALIQNDGFVIGIANRRPLDTDALGALASSALRFFEKGGVLVQTGPRRRIVFEYGGRAIILTPVSSEKFLAVVSETPSVSGTLAYAVSQAGDRLAAAL
ncbi:MAG TPA: roadblock/LC7 domain-containing protein [Methanoregula sp.]|nr:roadblock/LC7 domain-containing protein [Methanoregula sp.]